jgi:hypothetical protein
MTIRLTATARVEDQRATCISLFNFRKESQCSTVPQISPTIPKSIRVMPSCSGDWLLNSARELFLIRSWTKRASVKPKAKSDRDVRIQASSVLSIASSVRDCASSTCSAWIFVGLASWSSTYCHLLIAHAVEIDIATLVARLIRFVCPMQNTAFLIPDVFSVNAHDISFLHRCISTVLKIVSHQHSGAI